LFDVESRHVTWLSSSDLQAYWHTAMVPKVRFVDPNGSSTSS